MSDLKQKILTIMEKNSKVGVADLAVLLGDTEENIARAIYEMEQDKIICGYHTLINWNKANNE
ncbi:MAG: Lrp/AsnC family transcriptional regulator, partial [Lachnospiraceae bacterium]|nr:Lrp/AsnC family transcriptional regulator [Lachnospiraceae bacterium]